MAFSLPGAETKKRNRVHNQRLCLRSKSGPRINPHNNLISPSLSLPLSLSLPSLLYLNLMTGRRDTASLSRPQSGPAVPAVAMATRHPTSLTGATLVYLFFLVCLFTSDAFTSRQLTGSHLEQSEILAASAEAGSKKNRQSKS